MYPQSFFLKLVQKELSEFEDFLHTARDEEIQQVLAELHPADIADIVEEIDEASQTRLTALLDTARAAEVLSLVEDYHQAEVVEAIPEAKLVEIIDEMETDDATDILEDLPPEEAEEILESLPPNESEEMRELLQYPEDTAGGLMQAELVSVLPNNTIAQAAQRVREEAQQVSHIQKVYVVDEGGKLLGMLPLERLILESQDKMVSEAMDKNFISVPVDLDQEKVAEIFRKYDLIVVPVVDAQGLLKGRILVDDVVDVIQEEASEDIFRLAGVNTEEHVSDPPFRSIRLRLPWLLFNLVTAMVAAAVVGLFQNTIQKVVLLAVFMPIVAGMGGNAGTQSLAVITRGLALGDISIANAKRVLLKEVFGGVLNGIVIGGLMALVAYFFAGSPVLGLVLGLALVANLFVAALTGTGIPLILKWANVDPALASGVIVTTFTDVAGFFSFLGLATLFLHYLT